MSVLALNECQDAKLHRILDQQIPNILQSASSEQEKLKAIGAIMESSFVLIEDLSSEMSSVSPFGDREIPFVEIDIEHSPVREYDRPTLDLLAMRDKALKELNVPDDKRRKLLSEYQYQLLIRVPDPPEKARPNIYPSVLPPHDDRTLDYLALQDRNLKRKGVPDPERRLLLERFEGFQLLIQASERAGS